MAAPDIASQGEIFINVAGPGSALKKLERVKSIDIKDDRTTEVCMAVGVLRGAGFKRKQGGFSIDMEVYETVGRNPEVDWYLVNNSYSTFTIVTQAEGSGWRYAYTSKVSKVDVKFVTDDAVMMTVALVCTQVDRS
jgi:hypothetical protein